MTAWELLPHLQDLFSRFPEFRPHESWELQWVLLALNYTPDVEDEDEITAARALALTDMTGREAA